MKMKKINKLKQFRKHQAKLALLALAMSNLAHADLTSGLVAYYPFNGNVNDASGIYLNQNFQNSEIHRIDFQISCCYSENFFNSVNSDSDN